MTAGATELIIPAVFFVATTIRSTFGFGEALIAVPILALLLPVKVATPVAVLASITVALIVVLQDWRHVHARSAVRLVLSTLLGIPLGLLLLKRVPEPYVKFSLGVVILAFSLYWLLGRKRQALHTDGLAWIFGFVAGVLGGAYGMNGPPLAIYGSLRGWSPQQFRATLQGYFLPASVLVMSGYWAAGLWTSTVSHFYLLSLPFIIVAVFLGRAINRRLPSGRFVFYVHAGLIAIAAGLLLQALSRLR
jgi:uncharacterized membrane protein YfcA